MGDDAARSTTAIGINERFDEEGYWSSAWLRHLETYLSAAPRAGYWLERHFNRSLSVLELAGGSCRDSRYLAHRGTTAIGTDFDHKTLEYLEQRFPASPLKLQREDGFALTLPDKSVDISFSNGFWVLYDDDERILSLLREQARVTRRYLIALVHNGENAKLRAEFGRKAASDSLYLIRFFARADLVRLAETSGVAYRSLRLLKFGGPADLLFQAAKTPTRLGRRSWAGWLVPHLYDLQPWTKVERIALVLEL
jgi:hypothetical protein